MVTREIVRQGARWCVHETDARTVPGTRGPHCLIFDSEGIVRRVWTYPPSWSELAADDLWALLESATVFPRATPAAPLVVRLVSTANHPAVAAATAAAARARAIQLELDIASEQNGALRAEQRDALAECSRVRTDMRQVIESYAGTLRRGGVAPEEVLVLVKSAMHTGLGGTNGSDEPGSDELVRDGVSWAIAAYYAA